MDGKIGTCGVRRASTSSPPPLSTSAAWSAPSPPKGRHCFLIPWRGHTLIGTTDKPYEGHPDDYRVTRPSIEELIAAVNASFDGLSLTLADVRHCYGGLRPLVETQTAETYKSSRKYEIHDHHRDGLRPPDHRGRAANGPPAAIWRKRSSIWYGKRPLLPIPPSISERQYLAGSAIRDMHTFRRRTVAANRDFAESTITYLGEIYGTDIQAVLDLARQDKALAEPMNAAGRHPGPGRLCRPA